MRITSRLLHVASLLVATGYGVACGGSVNDESGFDGGPGGSDAGSDAPVTGCGGCGCGSTDGASPPTANVTAAQACAVMESDGVLSGFVSGPACQAYCPSPYSCSFPSDFTAEMQALNADAGPVESVDGGDGGATDAGPAYLCPTSASPITISCSELCLGRLTEGYDTLKLPRQGTMGDRFAVMAHLEAVSVHAFERLERELRAHGASADLVRDAQRARRDEIRHTKITANLARKRGAAVRLPDAPTPTPSRSLFDVALENAVEGCVRETYGAVMGLLEAETSPDDSVRRAMRSLATDECRHAELAWAIHEWALPQLTSEERARVEEAKRTAIAEIAARDARTAALLFS